jgi:hypothetical protein
MPISSRSIGNKDENGKVTIEKLLSYDVVADPPFSEAKMKRVDYFNPPKPSPPKPNPHPDIDPYGEEDWDDNNTTTKEYWDWNEGEGNLRRPLLPLAVKISTQTIGLDLVAVKPMGAPMGLMYFDYKYGEPEKPKGKQIFNEIDPYGEECWEE